MTADAPRSQSQTPGRRHSEHEYPPRTTASDTVLIPAEIADSVRDGLRSRIANAAQAIVNSNGLVDGREHPERYQEPLRHIDACRSLIEELGWRSSSEDVRVNLKAHEWALTQALQGEISVLADIVRDNSDDTECRTVFTGQLQELMPFALAVLLKARARTVQTAG